MGGFSRRASQNSETTVCGLTSLRVKLQYTLCWKCVGVWNSSTPCVGLFWMECKTPSHLPLHWNPAPHPLSSYWSFRTRGGFVGKCHRKGFWKGLFWGINDIAHRFTNNIVCVIVVVVKEVDSWPPMGSWKEIWTWIGLDQLLLDWVGTSTFVVELLIAALKGWWGFGYIRSVGLSFLLLLLLVDIDMGEEISSEGWVTSGIVQIVQILSVNR